MARRANTKSGRTTFSLLVWPVLIILMVVGTRLSCTPACPASECQASGREVNMQNIEVTEKNGKLVITIDPKQEQGLSKSGKTVKIASSVGPQKIVGDLTLNLDVWKKPEA